jgi:ribulose-5-phosphate 4-epimerase/fuculose-1-phosphate aldolase
MVAYYGWDDLIFTHLSARVPGPDHHFLLNPYNLMFEEVTASSLVKVDQHGNPVEPTPFITNPAGFTIHSALHMGRADAHAVMHLHTPQGQAVSAHAEGLLPLTQTAMLVRGEIGFHDYEGVAVDLEERGRPCGASRRQEPDAAAQPRHARGGIERRRMLHQALLSGARLPGPDHGALRR